MIIIIAFFAAMIVGIPSMIDCLKMREKDEDITVSAVIAYHLMEACAYAIVLGVLANVFELAGVVITI